MAVATAASSGADPEIALDEDRLKKLALDSESAETIEARGPLALLIAGLAIGLSIYALYWTQFSVNTTLYRSSFLAVVLVLALLMHHAVLPGSRMAPAVRLGQAAMMLGLIGGGWWVVASSRSATADGIGMLAGGSLALLAAGAWSWRQGRSLQQILDRLVALAGIGLAIAAVAYLAIHAEALKTVATRPAPIEVWLGLALILVVLEATRRTTGPALPLIALAFFAYAYFGDLIPGTFGHRGYRIERIVGQNYLTLEGLLSTPMDVAATFIILFTIYGAVLDKGGAGRFFIDWAFALFGRNPSRSAPGRAVVASGFLLGTVSGSGVATTVTLGSLAWPLLKRSGYDPNTGGGMIAASGIGATLSPPTLGAAAFIIAEYLDIDYLDVLVMATIPTWLYYLSCWLMVEGDARRLGVRAVRTSDRSIRQLTLSQGYHFLSLGAIAVLLAMGYTSFLAVFWSIVVAIILSMLRQDSRVFALGGAAAGAWAMALYLIATTPASFSTGPTAWYNDPRVSVACFWGVAVATLVSALLYRRAAATGRAADPGALRLVQALEDGGRGVVGIACTCATAGLIVSVITLTGLGQTLANHIVDLGGGSRLGTVALAAVAMWVLGTAVPVTASYIVAAVVLVPALKAVGVPEPAAHMFMFYYAVLADVSPPTALAPFAASAITGGRPFSTMGQAWKYSLPAFLVPFMFCLSPEGTHLLLMGEPLGILWTTLTASLALVGLALACTGQAIRRAGWAERALGLASGLCLLGSAWEYTLLGVLLLAAAIGLNLLRPRMTEALPAAVAA